MLPSAQSSFIGNESFTIGGKILEQDSKPQTLKKHMSGQDFDTANFQRTKIDLQKQSL